MSKTPPDNRRPMPPRQRPSMPLAGPGHNTGPCKVPPQAVYRAGRVPAGARRYWAGCRPVIGYVVCIALGAFMAISAGLAMAYFIVTARH